ncbi:hypothetical protein FT643_05550 [Ketobacter sp. MCCC 1A13808]|uniref:malectin domain-containing carbohydrate-binding protein n=1 Tax=Ketobacter sp. MCCC 1A13808 TaxID=2602738 RepID=UPI000F299426|nr:malectin domain-containing carbohydrate-binding protein [Ketobacter sp. MCCC 1A13808]MVF11605.1 hypothetical protein [Ketobacter sp. MCCC 1A13808]RLP55216.1 MAG: hypothetical protein D6160_05550 [Ketobacter sp.]
MSISITRTGLLKVVSTSCLALVAGAAFSASDISPTDIRINAGGKQFTDSAGHSWSADFGFNGGITASNLSLGIKNTIKDTLYQSRRRHTSNEPDLSYAIPVADGTYNVRLHFSENYQGAFKNGARVFKVAAEGKTDPTSIDVFKEAGDGYRALIRYIDGVKVTDGKLNITFTDLASTAFVSGIEVLSAETTAPTVEKVVYRINSGGGKVTDSNGVQWYADNHFINGLTASVSANTNIIGTADDDIYLSRRRHTSSQSDLEYAFPVNNGNYSVRLHFSENYDGTFGFGKRVFDIFAEDKIRKNDFDVYSKAGSGYTAVNETISNINVEDGTLNIRFLDQKSTAFVSAIEVIANEEVSTGGDTNNGSSKIEAIYRVNAGGTTYKDGAGNTWSADAHFNAGKTASNPNQAIAKTSDDTIYQSRRRNSAGDPNLVYSFPVDAGEYSVNLHFSENYSGTFKNGARVFDVYSEGNKIVDSLDVFAATGKGNTALVRNIPSIKVSDGYLTLRFTDTKSTAFISGIEVMKISAASTGNNSGDSTGAGNTGNATPLAFTAQPSNEIVNPGRSVTLSVSAKGPASLNYQWYFKGGKISGANNSDLKLTSVTSNNAGQYYCVVTSNGKSVTSNTVKLIVAGTSPVEVKNDATISWAAPAKRANGKALPKSEISQYEIFHGVGSAGNMTYAETVPGTQLKYEFKSLDKGTHYFAVQTVDHNGVRSKQSQPIQVVIK